MHAFGKAASGYATSGAATLNFKIINLHVVNALDRKPVSSTSVPEIFSRVTLG